MKYELNGKINPNYSELIELIIKNHPYINNSRAVLGDIYQLSRSINTELIKYSIDEIDYVIIHELCHFLEFNHSPRFWKYVKKYKPNYKENTKVLKEE